MSQDRKIEGVVALAIVKELVAISSQTEDITKASLRIIHYKFTTSLWDYRSISYNNNEF